MSPLLLSWSKQSTFIDFFFTLQFRTIASLLKFRITSNITFFKLNFTLERGLFLVLSWFSSALDHSKVVRMCEGRLVLCVWSWALMMWFTDDAAIDVVVRR